MVRRWMVLLSCLAATAAGAVGIDQRLRESSGRLHPHLPQQGSTQREVPATPRRALPPVAATDALGASYTYDAVGNRATATYPNGLVTHYTYDPLDRLVELHTTHHGATVQRYRFILDPDGARRRIDATEMDGAARVTDYTYGIGEVEGMSVTEEDVGGPGCLDD